MGRDTDEQNLTIFVQNIVQKIPKNGCQSAILNQILKKFVVHIPLIVCAMYNKYEQNRTNRVGDIAGHGMMDRRTDRPTDRWTDGRTD